MIDNGIVDIEKYLKDKFDYSFNGDLDEFYNKKIYNLKETELMIYFG